MIFFDMRLIMKKILIFLIIVILLGCNAGVRQFDKLAPWVKVTLPCDGAVGVKTNSKISIIFSEPDKKSMVNSRIKLHDGYIDITGLSFEWSENNEAVTLILPANRALRDNTTYTLTVKPGYEDLARNISSQQYIATFSTSNLTVAPFFIVEKVIPVDNSVDVHVSNPQYIHIFFSDEVNPASIENSNFLLESPSAGHMAEFDIIIGVNLREIVLKTKNKLYTNATYNITVKNRVEDNRIPPTALGRDYTSTFTTTNNRYVPNDVMLKFFREKSKGGKFKSTYSGVLRASDLLNSPHYEEQQK